jgi:hypothetical protein
MNLQSGILHALTNTLHDVNPFINIYEMAKERLDQQANLKPGQEARILLNRQLQLILEVRSDHRCYNLQTSDELAMILLAEDTDKSFSHIVLVKLLCTGLVTVCNRRQSSCVNKYGLDIYSSTFKSYMLNHSIEDFFSIYIILIFILHPGIKDVSG